MSDPLVPQLGVALNALEGLVLHREGRAGRGLRPATVRLARKLAARHTLTEEEAREMRAWFARFINNGPARAARQRDPKSPAMVSWLLRGGDAARAWLDEIEIHLLKIPSKGRDDG